VGLLLVALQSRTIWLPWIAQNLIVDDRLRPADVMVIFAAREARAKHAARLYQEGLAPRILVTGGLTSTETELFCHERVTGARLSAKMLTDSGIPASAVIVLPHGTSTYEEAETIKAFMVTHGYGSLIAISSPYHMRRVRATLAHLLRGTGVEALYSPAKETGFKVSEWWRREHGLIQVTNEYLKLAYYHLALF
jgi:uncharacterized SAM-binding protein YcdF (DUF218 family)